MQFVKRMRALGAVIALLGSISFTTNAQEITPEYTHVDLDNFIAVQKPAMPGTRTILPPNDVSFTGVLMEGPKQIKVKYLFEALSVMNVTPLPKVSHRMFISSRQGKVIPVYVEDAAVEEIQKKIKVDEEALFLAYHVYNYSKGPAVVVRGLGKK
ncbi:MAG: hypothetical protein MI743_12250 [Sneathiellales bacterium]|nr:hypothetical protein [Sneathiellales bacterium]